MMLGNLRFVRLREEDRNGDGGGSLLKKAAEVVRNKGVEPEWEGPGVATGDKGLIYVMDNFDCPDFKLLLGKCRIIGPAVVLAHINKGWPLPASRQPVFSLAMRGVVACFTQTGAREKRDRLSQLVSLMGGKVQKDYTKRVTHLIAGQVGSTKYNVARDLGMPVMLPSWVDHCWTAGLDTCILALDPEIVKAHKCPPLTGCTVAVTGLEETERRKARELVKTNGGAYSGELTKDICTHLLVASTNSAKYKFAQEWQMHCVSLQWLYDSARRGYCLAETSYSVGGGAEEDKKKTDNEGAVSSGSGVTEWTGSLEDYHIPTSPSETVFLDGCKVFLAGFSDNQLQKLHKIINLGGGARYNHLSESLTHVVLGVQEPSTVDSIRNLAQIPHVVSALWLLACCTEGGRVDEQQYTCLDVSTPGEGVRSDDGRVGKGEEVGRKRRREGGEGRGESGAKRARVSEVRAQELNGEKDDDETRLDDEALLLQYKNAEFPEVSERGKEADQQREGERNGILRGLKLAVSCLFPSEDQSLATSVLQEHSGEVLGVSEAVYLLSPLEVVDRTDPGREKEVNSTATPVTMIWLQRSIEAGVALEPSSNFLFQPLTKRIVDTALTGCVLAFSQFSDLEREHLIRFSKGLGAVVQDYFTHYPAHGLLATTHIVLRSPEGDKYQHALQWGVPAVADSWLFECAKRGSIVPVEPHLIKQLHKDHHSPHEHSTSTSGSRTGLAEGEGGKQRAGDDVGGAGEGVLESGGVGDSVREGVTVGGGEVCPQGEEERGRVLDGVVICIHKKIPTQAQLHNLAGSLGADCHWSFNSSCTHYVYQGKAAEAVRDRGVRAARENSCLIVSPHWIHACVSEGRRVEEAAYPHTYNPNYTLDISVQVSVSPQKRGKTPSSKSESKLRSTVQSDKQRERKTEVGGAVGGRVCEEGETGEGANDPVEKEEVPESEIVKRYQLELEALDRVAREKRRRGGNSEPVDKEEAVTGDVVESDIVRRFQQHLDELNNAARDKRRRKSRRLQQKDPDVVAPPTAPPPAPSGLRGRRQQPRQRRSRRTRKREEALTDSQIPDSQVLQVTYDDPEGRREKAKLLARIEREEKLREQGLDPEQFREGSSSSLEEGRLELDLPHSELTTTAPAAAAATSGQVTLGEQTQASSASSRGWGVAGGAGPEGLSSTPLPPCLGVPIVTHSKGNKEVKSLFDERAMQAKRKARTPPKFLLSALERSEKVDYAALVQELGGECIDLDYYTNSCTHLVVGRVSRTEKFLGACAGGKWVLHKSYLEACRVERRFVEEEGHEWGVGTRQEELQPLDNAPRRWRLILAQQRTASEVDTVVGAFRGWKVLLYAERHKASGLRRLLEAGGARVFTNTTKFSEGELKQVSHAFISTNHFPKDTLSPEELVRCGVACLKPEYISDYLSKGNDIPLEPYFIREVKTQERYEE